MRKKHAAQDHAGTWAAVPPGRIGPADVQEKEFKVARFTTGYRMREVDEFLDQITDTLAGLIAENDRLRSGAAGSTDRPVPAASPPASAADRTAVEAFLQRERDFLQSLGGLVQGHAEELKRMVREARRTEISEREPAQPVVDETSVEEQEGAIEEPVVVPEPSRDGDREPASASVPGEAPTSEATDRPVAIEEPEPARSSRADESSEGSLRELFWGED